MNDLKEGDAVSSQLFSIALEYVVGRAAVLNPSIKLSIDNLITGIGTVTLKITENQTKYMYVTRNTKTRDELNRSTIWTNTTSKQ